MRISHYLYNAFIVEHRDKKLAIDPGGLMFYYFRFSPLIPRSEWPDVTHIFVTHGDPDHHWHTDRIARVSGAPVICNRSMTKEVDGEIMMLGPRSKGLAFDQKIDKLITLSVDEGIHLDGMHIMGIKTTHGPLKLKFGPFTKTFQTGAKERLGWGAIGFKIQLGTISIINLGDTLLHEEEWRSLQNADVLMIPIGGRDICNTMDEHQALKAVLTIKPKLVIPCHYNLPAFFSRRFNGADVVAFREEVQKNGIECHILEQGDSLEI